MAAVLPSRRELIFQHMLEALEQVTFANGYEAELRFIRRGNFDVLRAPAYPAALLLPDRDEPESGPTSVNRHTLTVHVLVWVKDEDGTTESVYPTMDSASSTLPTQLETVLTAVQRAMMSNQLWHSLADHTDEGQTEYLLLDNQDAACGATMTYTVHYRTSIEDSTVPAAVLAMTKTWPAQNEADGDDVC